MPGTEPGQDNQPERLDLSSIDLTTGDARIESARQYLAREAEAARLYKLRDTDFETFQITRINEHSRWFDVFYNVHWQVHVSKSLGFTPEAGDIVRMFGKYAQRGVDIIKADGTVHEIFYRNPEQQARYQYELEAHRREVRGDNW